MPGLTKRKEAAPENVHLWCYECEQWVEVEKFELIDGSNDVGCPECKTILRIEIEINTVR